VPARGDEFHPRLAAERQVEAGVGRIGRAVHEQQRALRRERREIGRPLVADIDFDARLGGHHEFFGDDLSHRRNLSVVMAGLDPAIHLFA
jgi:hypothetical protein